MTVAEMSERMSCEELFNWIAYLEYRAELEAAAIDSAKRKR